MTFAGQEADPAKNSSSFDRMTPIKNLVHVWDLRLDRTYVIQESKVKERPFIHSFMRRRRQEIL